MISLILKKKYLFFLCIIVLNVLICNSVSAQRISNCGAEMFADKIISLGIKRGDELSYYSKLIKYNANEYWMYYAPKGRDSSCRIILKVDDDGYVDKIMVFGTAVSYSGRENVVVSANVCLGVLGLSPDEIIYLSEEMDTYNPGNGDICLAKSVWSNTIYKTIRIYYVMKADRSFAAFIDEKKD